MPKRRHRRPQWDFHDPFHDPILDAPIADSVDLHRKTREEAQARLGNFLVECRRLHSGQVVHIITGKGRGSLNGPVLKPLVKRMLESHFKGLVAEWKEDDDGGGYKVRIQ